MTPTRTVDTSLLTSWLTLLTVEQQSKQIDAMEKAAREMPTRRIRRRSRPTAPAEPIAERAVADAAERERRRRSRTGCGPGPLRRRRPPAPAAPGAGAAAAGRGAVGAKAAGAGANRERGAAAPDRSAAGLVGAQY